MEPRHRKNDVLESEALVKSCMKLFKKTGGITSVIDGKKLLKAYKEKLEILSKL